MSDLALLGSWAWMAGAVAVQILWQGALLGAFAAAGLALLRGRPPHVRYAFACAALVGMAALLPLNLATLEIPEPVAAQALPAQRIVATDGVAPPTAWSDSSPEIARDEAATPVPATAAPEAPEITRDERPPAASRTWYDPALPWIGRAWFAGLLLFALYDMLGLIAVRRLRKQAYPAGPALLELAEALRARMGIRATVQIRVVEGLSSALVTGFFRVVVLVPAAMATGMTPAAIEAILAHEFAHIRRWDHWVNGFQRLIQTLLFFHPAVWWISRRIRVERELCCDAMVLEVGADRATYARALLALAEASPGRPAWALSSHGGSLPDRVRAILHGPAPGEGPVQGRLAAALVALAVTVLPFAVTLYSNLSHAQELPERVLRFPSDRSVGTVYGRWADEDYRTAPWMPDHNEGWTVLAPARGDVVVPENTLVKLTVGTTDLAYLRQLDPESLFFLDARHQKLTDADIAPISTLAGLRALDLSDAPLLSGACLRQLGGLTELEWLDFARTPIDGLPLGAIAQFPALQFVAAHFNAYGSQAMEEIAALDHIEYVCVKASSLQAEDMERLSGKDSLRALILDKVELTDAAFAALRTAPNLLYLDLKKNPLSDDVLADIDRFPRLRHLDLENTGVGDAGVAYLRQHPTLEQLYLTSTPVTEAVLPTLAALPALRAVKLVDTGVSDAQAGALAAKLSSRPENQVRPQQSSNPDAPRVGLMMSHYTATGPYLISRPYGYSVQDSNDLARHLDESNFEVFAVIEPGSETLGELPGILHQHGLTEKTVDAFDAEALLELDVIVVSTLYNARPEFLKALDVGLLRGLGLLNIGALCGAPGAPHN